MTTYYVAQSSAGGDTGVDCANAKSLTWFNTNGVAGDTAILCDGSYTTQINPTNSGTSGNPITYIADNQYGAVLSTSSYGYKLQDVNYITVDGIYFNDIGSYFGYLYNAEYCIIQNNKFYDSESYGGTFVGYTSSYNRFLNNTFEDAPINTAFELTDCDTLPYTSSCDCDTAPADFISVYSGIGNVMENNTFGLSSHGSINLEPRAHSPWGDSDSDLSIVRNNNFNNQYHTGLDSSHRVLSENNRFYDIGDKYDENPNKSSRDDGRTESPGLYIMSSGSILRNNICDNCGWGIIFGSVGDGSKISIHERYYQNTLYNNVYQVMHTGNSGADYNDNILKNNIMFNAQLREWSNYADYDYANNTENYAINNVFTPNATNFYFKNTNTTARSLSECQTLYPLEWHADNFEADPVFMDAANRNFILQTTSPCLNAGTHLTTISSATNTGQTTIIVDDAGYFYDGWSIPSEVGDTVMTEAGEETVIQSIDYTTNTLTVSPAIDIVNGEGLSLTYTGTSPNVGAYQGVGEAGSGVHYPYIRTRGIFRAPMKFNLIGGRFK